MNPAFIILGADRPFSGEQHAGLRATGQGRVLDWTLRAVADVDPDRYFVCGYQADALKADYPGFHYVPNEEWESTKAGWSLLLGVEGSDRECIVSYSDILFRPAAVQQLMQQTGDAVIAVDGDWRTRYSERTQRDLERCEKACVAGGTVTRLGSDIAITQASAEFIGLVRLSPKAVRLLRELRAAPHSEKAFLRQARVSDLIELLRIRGLNVAAVDVRGDWAELNEPADLVRFVLGTKAQTLSRLRGMVTHARIEDQVSFTVQAWNSAPPQWITAIQTQFDRGNVVVRSSALSEDSFYYSNAGAYTSLLNIETQGGEALHRAVEQVIASYPDGNPANEVLVQPMLTGVLASGVVFTRALASGAPYYVVNYDDVSGSTESITSGSSKEHKTLVMRRDADAGSAAIPPRLAALLPALREIESLLGYDALDVEFAVTEEGGLHILQVRPIAVDHSSWRDDAEAYFHVLLAQAEARFVERQAASPFVCGQRTVFGVMPDWNPAEIIGTKPGQLAVSLYRSLIMDDTWATQRAEYGYRDVRPHSLLVGFAGHPYVDVRASFNSFIPAEVPDGLAARIVDFCLDWLEARPHLHDKVEFEVIPTCFSLDFDQWEARFGSLAGLRPDELSLWRDALQKLTVRAMERSPDDLARIARLEARYAALVGSALAPLDKAFALLNDARRYGTLPFAHLARSAFVAITLLRSAVATGVLTRAEMDDFLASIRTVSHTFTHDAQACARGDLAWADFVERYGHLRPGTYDIASPSYRQDAERYLRPTVARALLAADAGAAAASGTAWHKARGRFVAALNARGIPGSVDAVEAFLRQAIEGREYAKFAFTRNLSTALDALREWGEGIGVDASVLGEVSIDDVRAIQSGQVTVTDMRAWLTAQAARVRTYRHVVNALELPPLLCRREDFVVFQYPATQANFIGGMAIVACCVDFETADEDLDLAGKIVLIPQADPGYDWLFGRQIGGLVTMYGGANSHMAIRAAEFGLPAAIGVGEVRYRSLATAKELELNPINRTIRILH